MVDVVGYPLQVEISRYSVVGCANHTGAPAPFAAIRVCEGRCIFESLENETWCPDQGTGTK